MCLPFVLIDIGVLSPVALILSPPPLLLSSLSLHPYLTSPHLTLFHPTTSSFFPRLPYLPSPSSPFVFFGAKNRGWVVLLSQRTTVVSLVLSISLLSTHNISACGVFRRPRYLADQWHPSGWVHLLVRGLCMLPPSQSLLQLPLKSGLNSCLDPSSNQQPRLLSPTSTASNLSGPLSHAL